MPLIHINYPSLGNVNKHVTRIFWENMWRCMKIVQKRSFFWFVFSCIQSEYRKIQTTKNSVFGQFSRSVNHTETVIKPADQDKKKLRNTTAKVIRLWSLTDAKMMQKQMSKFSDSVQFFLTYFRCSKYFVWHCRF